MKKFREYIFYRLHIIIASMLIFILLLSIYQIVVEKIDFDLLLVTASLVVSIGGILLTRTNRLSSNKFIFDEFLIPVDNFIYAFDIVSSPDKEFNDTNIKYFIQLYELYIIPIITGTKFDNKHKENLANKIFEYSESRAKNQRIVEYAPREILVLLTSLYEETVQASKNDFKNYKNTLDEKYQKLKTKVDMEFKNARNLNGLSLD